MDHFLKKEQTNRRVWLDRYFIDKKYQGKEYGSIFLKQLTKHLLKKYNCNEIYLSVYNDNTFESICMKDSDLK